LNYWKAEPFSSVGYYVILDPTPARWIHAGVTRCAFEHGHNPSVCGVEHEQPIISLVINIERCRSDAVVSQRSYRSRKSGDLVGTEVRQHDFEADDYLIQNLREC